jgi:hypothetical protein
VFRRVEFEARDLPGERKVGDARALVLHDLIEFDVAGCEQCNPAFRHNFWIRGVEFEQRFLALL